MVDRDQDGKVKKTLKEKLDDLVGKVPGLSGYLDREAARERDKLLRTHTFEKIGGVKDLLDNLKSELLAQKHLGLLDDLDQLTRKLDRARDTHRFDAYGFSGAFDRYAVLEDSLAKLYDYDLKLLEEVEKAHLAVNDLIGQITEEAVRQALPGLRQTTGEILDLVLERKQVLLKIGE